MPAPQQIPQTTFVAGEVSPMVAVRTDMQTYNAALAKARNALIHPQGAVSNRSGSIFVDVSASPLSSNSVLVDFARDDNSVFIIEFSAARIDIWNTITKLKTKTITAGVPYADAAIKKLKFLQSADALFIFHNDYPIYELRHISATNWEIVKTKLKNGPFRVSNDNNKNLMFLYAEKQAASGGYGATSYVVEIKAGGNFTFNANMEGSLFRIAKSVNAQGYYEQIQAVKSSGAFLAGGGAAWHLLTTGTWSGEFYLQRSYDYANWEDLRCYNSSENMNYEDSGTIDELCWLRITVKKTLGGSTQAKVSFNIQAFVFDAIFELVRRNSDTKAFGNLTNDIVGLDIFLPSTNLVPEMTSDTLPEGTVTSNGTTAQNENAFKIFSGNVADGVSGRGVNSGFFYDFPVGKSGSSNKFMLKASAGFGSGQKIQWIVRGKTAAGADDVYDSGHKDLGASAASYSLGFTRKINVYRVEVYFPSTFNASTKLIAQFLDTPDEDWTDDWSEGAFSVKNGYPSNGAFYQDRLVLVSSKSDPAGVWMSKTGFYTDLGISNPLVDSDSISINLPSRKINKITNIAVLSDIVVFTQDGSFSISAGGGAISPFNVLSKPQSYRGATETAPAVVGNRILFVSSKGFYLRDMAYALSDDGYDGEDLRVRAGHMFEGRQIVDIAYQQFPDSVVWALRDDGKLIALTYMREQQILAFTLNETDGFIENIAITPTSQEEQLYLIVKRNGQKYLERFEPRTFDTKMQHCEFGDYERLVNDCFLDCASVSDASAGSEGLTFMTGLERFSGKEVIMNLDGSVYRGTVDGSGRLDFIVKGQPIKAYRAIVGLPFVFHMETLSLALKELNIQNAVGKTPFARIDFYKSVGGSVGARDGALYPLIQRRDEMMGMPVKLQTGKTDRINLETQSQTAKGITIKQAEALPITVLAVSIAVMGGEK